MTFFHSSSLPLWLKVSVFWLNGGTNTIFAFFSFMTSIKYLTYFVISLYIDDLIISFKKFEHFIKIVLILEHSIIDKSYLLFLLSLTPKVIINGG